MDTPKLIAEGLALQEQNDWNAAEAIYQKILAQEQDNIDALHFLGVIAYRRGQLEKANQLISQALSYNPEYFAALSNLALVLRDLNELDEAESLLLKAIKIKNDVPSIYNCLAGVYLSQTKYHEAEQACITALALQQDYVEALVNMGNALQGQGLAEKAKTYYQQALSIKPYAQTYCNLANLYLAENKIDQAMAHFHHALELNPNSVNAHFNVANLYKQLGQLDKAVMHYEQVLRIKPDHAATHRALSSLNIGDRAQHIAQMQSLLQHISGDCERKIHLYFALGRAFDEQKDYQQAFAYWQQGNQLKRSQYQYDGEIYHAIFAQLKRAFTPEFIKQHSGQGFASRTPIFIVGMPRSGTTLLEKILGTHSQVYAAGELDNLRQSIEALYATPADLLGRITQLHADEIYSLGKIYIDSLPEQPLPICHIVDKMPSNFMYLGLIKLILPQAKIIHCLRHPLATILSCYQLLFTNYQPFAYDLQELADYYMAYSDLMHHWRQMFANEFLEIKYEDLVSEQEQQTRRVLDFCELPFEPACLEFHKQRELVKTASATQVIKPMYQDSINKWENYAEYLQPVLQRFAQQGG